MKTAEQQENDLMVAIGRLAYCATQNDWKRFEIVLRAFTNQIQSDAIESTVKRCAKIAEESEACCGTGEVIAKQILSLIPQKEKKV